MMLIHQITINCQSLKWTGGRSMATATDDAEWSDIHARWTGATGEREREAATRSIG